MLGELQRKKLKRKFQIFDANGDGFVQRDDFDLIIGNLLKLRDLSADSSGGQAIADQYIDYWLTLQHFVDANQDEKITMGEWMTYHEAALEFEKVLAEQGEEGTLRPFAEVLFQMLDRNGDGQVSADEYHEFLQAYQLDVEAARQAFEHLDQQGKGHLTLDELFALVDDFYTSNNPDSPGNWLFGPLP